MDKFLLDEKRRIVSIKDIEGPHRLKVFDRIGILSSYTDFAYALGGELLEREGSYVSSYVLKDASDEHSRKIVVGEGIETSSYPHYFAEGVRLVSVLPKELEKEIDYDNTGVPYVLYGEYPQVAATHRQAAIIQELEPETNDRYVVPDTSTIVRGIKKPEDAIKYAKEYELDGRKLARLQIRNVKYQTLLFSNGTQGKPLEHRLFRSIPIKWYVDEETGLLVSDKILSANIPFCYLDNHKDDVKRLILK